MDPSTAKFEAALPLVLFPVSPELSALHSARTSLPSLPYACSKCGSLLASTTRLIRSHSSTHLLHTVCRLCTRSCSIPIGPLNAESFPSSRTPRSPPTHRSTSQSPVAANVTSLVAPTLASASSPATPRPSAKSRKKPGLQEMLQRNREKVKKRTTQDQAKPTGLSIFLSTL